MPDPPHRGHINNTLVLLFRGQIVIGFWTKLQQSAGLPLQTQGYFFSKIRPHRRIFPLILCSNGYTTSRAFSFYSLSIHCTVFTPYQNHTQKHEKVPLCRSLWSVHIAGKINVKVREFLKTWLSLPWCPLLSLQSRVHSVDPFINTPFLGCLLFVPFPQRDLGTLGFYDVIVVMLSSYFIISQVKMNNMEYISAFSPIKTRKLNLNVNKHFYEFTIPSILKICSREKKMKLGKLVSDHTVTIRVLHFCWALLVPFPIHVHD